MCEIIAVTHWNVSSGSLNDLKLEAAAEGLNSFNNPFTLTPERFLSL